MAQQPQGDALEAAADFARLVNEPQREDERLEVGLALLTELVEGCDHAGVTMVRRDGVETTAATSGTVWQADALQYELGEGPCLDSVRVQSTVLCNDLPGDRRWPRWGPAVSQRLGVGSVLSLLLYTRTDSYGALNLYADRDEAFSSDDLLVAGSLAAHLAVAVASGREIDTRGQAMVTRTVIGQAEGILMERYGISAEQAFQVLRRVSQTTHRKLVDVAQELVSTGHTEGLPVSRG